MEIFYGAPPGGIYEYGIILSKLLCSFLFAGGGAEYHRRQCFPHGVRGAASASADPSGCNLTAIDAVLSQRQAGAPIVVGKFF